MTRIKIITTAATALVMVVLVPSASAATPKSGSYAGVGNNDLTVGMRVHGKDLDRIVYSGSLGKCSATGNLPDTTIHADGHFKSQTKGSDYKDTLKGRFVSPNKVRGRFTDVESDPGTCPGKYRDHFVMRAFRPIATSGHAGAPANGRYAGAGKNGFVWFDVKHGQIQPNGSTEVWLPNCGDRANIFTDAGPVTDKGQFSLYGSQGNNAMVLGGHFANRKTVSGTLLWNTSDDCPAGTTKFPYAAARLGPLE